MLVDEDSVCDGKPDAGGIRKSGWGWYDRAELIGGCRTGGNFSWIINIFHIRQYTYNYLRYYQTNTNILRDGPIAMIFGKFDIH